MDLNYFNCTGRFTKDPELVMTESGKTVCRFTLAVNQRQNKTTKETKVDFISFVAWENTANHITKYFKKGDQVAISGSLRVDNYEKNGEKKYSTYIIVDNVYFIGNKKVADKVADNACDNVTEE